MPVRQVAAAPQVKADAGRLALMRGPVVYCLEDCDNPCAVDRAAMAQGAAFKTRFEPDLLEGVVTLTTKGKVQTLVENGDALAVSEKTVDLKAIPYYAWDNRTPGNMVVWVPTDLAGLSKLKGATIAVAAEVSSSHCYSADTVAAVNDNILPESSKDQAVPRMTWWGHLGTREWLNFRFKKAKTLSRAEVYWFDDTGVGACRVPESWRVLYFDGAHWQPVEAQCDYGVEKDRFNAVRFKPVTTKQIRLEVQLQPKYSGGVLEWRLP